MSTRSRYRSVLDERSERVTAVAHRLGRLVFGDYRGVFVFLLSCSAAMVLWRTTFSINDNLTIANGLAALSDGHLNVATPTYGETLRTPGMAEYDGNAFPRNFAHIVVALPILWVLDGVAAVADVRVALAALWCLSVFATISVGGRLVARHETAHLVGGVVALGSFIASVAVATPFPLTHLAYLALQLATMLAAAGCALVLYRLLARVHSSDVGFAAGIAAGVASPALLWATIPKRHVLTALFALLTLFFLYRSRETDRVSTYRRYRAVAYVPVGLTAWLNASEGLVLLGALAAADFATARENGVRTLATVAAGFFVSLLPFFLTNYLLSGDPFTPPRMLDRYGADAIGTPVSEDMAATNGGSESGGGGGSTGGGAESGGGADSTGGGGGSTDSDGGILEGLVSGVAKPLIGTIDRALLFTEFLSHGLEAVRQEPGRLYHTFVRSGYLEFPSRGATGLAINVAFSEALPIAGALIAAPVLAVRTLVATVSESASPDLRSRPVRAADIFVTVYAALLTLLYIYRLPLHAMLTVRYVYPLFPLAVYAVARLPWVRATVAARPLWLGFSYVGSVLVGGQLVLVAVVMGNYTADETIQGLALLGLVVATATGLWSLAAAADRTNTSVGAVLVGLGSGLATILAVAFAVAFFGPTAEFVLPLVPV
ncbi:hypothetical protein [Natrinema salifodinae]|uniref:Uncharacterized protein n=1 Tax=Natrinema salifodinae TaxID=1202768 RepID=A0A1I0M0J3_9EURY|nr:hypothetical protein [Natrinema salifodinae]SEV81811.1 hypothetical protein SAMN05216285_0267 [Natrinema salifodinae]